MLVGIYLKGDYNAATLCISLYGLIFLLSANTPVHRSGLAFRFFCCLPTLRSKFGFRFGF